MIMKDIRGELNYNGISVFQEHDIIRKELSTLQLSNFCSTDLTVAKLKTTRADVELQCQLILARNLLRCQCTPPDMWEP